MLLLVSSLGIQCGKLCRAGVTAEQLLQGVLASHVLGQLQLVATVVAGGEGAVHHIGAFSVVLEVHC